MPVVREESVPRWFPVLVAIIVAGFLLFFFFFSPSKRFGPREAQSVEPAPADTLVAECGRVTRSHYLGDTLRVWIEGRDGITRGPFNFIGGLSVEVSKVYTITFYSKSRIVHRTDPPENGRCQTPAQSAGVSFS